MTGKKENWAATAEDGAHGARDGAQDEFFQTMNGFTSKDEDALTDPDIVTETKQSEHSEGALRCGQNLRAAREAKGFSVKEASTQTGINAQKLVQVEAGETILPLGHLSKLSKLLSLGIGNAISRGDATFTIVRPDQRERFVRYGKAKQDEFGYEYESLAPGKSGRKMEPFIVKLDPVSREQFSSHDGQEFIYVLEGEIEVEIGDTREVLTPGDAVYYDSKVNHLVRAHGGVPAKILAVLAD